MKFIESPDTQQGLPPFSFPGVSIAAFKIPANKQLLNDYCAKFLNISSEYTFFAADTHVYLGINTYPYMFSDNPTEKDVGYTTQNEYYFIFPVEVTQSMVGNFLMPLEVTFVFAYIGVDNSTSALTGQEVLGFQKLCGEINITPSTSDKGFTASVKMPSFITSGRNVPQDNLEIVKVDTGPSIPFFPPPSQVFPWVPRDVEYLNGLFDALYGMGIQESFAVVNLKQFRDGEQPSEAVYQALVRSECRMKPFSDWVKYENPKIKVTSNATFDIVKTLGLDVGSDGYLRVSGPGYAFTTDMWLENVTNLVVI